MARYRRRISGPLLDRIDLHVNVPAVPWKDLDTAPAAPETPQARARVEAARARQARRPGGVNARLPAGALDARVRATPEARALLARAVDRFGLSARGAHRVLRVARTVADLGGDAEVGPGALAEALGYRSV